MSNSVLPELIEPYKLADREVSLTGEAALENFQRFSELLVDTDGSVAISFRFARDEEGYRYLKGQLSAEVRVRCERCLEPMSMPVDTEFQVALAMIESQVPSIPKRYDAWVVSPDAQVSWIDLVEDELIMALPQFPSHQNPECEVVTFYGEEESEEPEEETKSSNPFDVLAGLKGQQ